MQAIVARSFSRKTLAALAARNVRVLAPVLIPDAAGSYLNPDQAWSIDHAGTGRIVRLAEVLELASA